jgi:hypothetical protein
MFVNDDGNENSGCESVEATGHRVKWILFTNPNLDNKYINISPSPNNI